MTDLEHIRFEIPAIGEHRPVMIIGAGGIVEGAHLPAYQLAGIAVAGIFDLDVSRAERVAARFNIPRVYHSLPELVAGNTAGGVYDIAVPGSRLHSVLSQLPDRSFVLMQKPMGENLEQAEQILALCRHKQMIAGVNFQLRYAPYIVMARQMMAAGMLGDICDLEVYVNVYTPWHLWDFLKGAERVEILYHSIHYIDLIRALLGGPQGIFAKSARHPNMQELAAVKSNIIMDYGDFMRVHISTNHVHEYGPDRQDAFIKIEGTRGAVKIKLGLLMNYPQGTEDAFEYILMDEAEGTWRRLPVNGSWFPHAFIGTMHELIKAQQGEVAVPGNSVEDCIHTMRLVESAYRC
ncbi:Gfo/Idh/MocA family protein [Chitinophaga alhagiae]|uniref:Gfo/Idh/MocA family protein n=1 Tax=Chitinophaga alhagiae TaxID=2203219 RepID=UPI000E5AB924|nr:Gfo/Idh/MocA family oxidoreductase [Chitinophaga alhagiae]